MDTVSTKLATTRASVLAEGQKFIEATRDAGRSLVEDTVDAGASFVRETRDAGVSFARDTRSASFQMFESLALEARNWAEFLKQPAPILTPELNGALRNGAFDTRAVEMRLLQGMRQALRSLAGRLEDRLGALSGDESEADTDDSGFARSNGVRTMSTRSDAMDSEAPLNDYDELNARTIVTKLQEMSVDEAQAVLEWEAQHKKRATVLKAAKQRLAA